MQYSSEHSSWLNSLYSGNFLVIASSSSTVIGLTWGGVKFPWASAHVLVPLIVGLLGLIGFMAYEATLARVPLVRRNLSYHDIGVFYTLSQVPIALISNRTSLSGYVMFSVIPSSPLRFPQSYIQTFIAPIIVIGTICKHEHTVNIEELAAQPIHSRQITSPSTTRRAS